LPIIVFDINKIGNLSKIMQGEQVGTLVTREGLLEKNGVNDR
jgi:uridylate kinase